MANEVAEPVAQPESDSGVTLSKSERFLARTAFAQTVTAVVAVLISCAAMYATWQQARAARVQTEAQVWPRIVSYTNLTQNESGEPVFEVKMANRGLGPAEVRSMRVYRGDEYIQRYSDIVDALLKFGHDVRIRSSYITYRIFAPGEEAVIIGAEGQAVIDAVNGIIDGYSVELCYCSILDQCRLLADDFTSPVNQCPDHGENEFRN